jgi:glycerol kinase
VHATDADQCLAHAAVQHRTNAWDDDLLASCACPRAMLPEVKDCAADFGMTKASSARRSHPRRRRRPAGGDHRPGLLRAGHDEIDLRHRLLRAAQHRQRHGALEEPLLTTIAYRSTARRTYALEGSIFIAGAAVQWLRDGLKASSSTHPRPATLADKSADPDAERLSRAGLRRPRRAALGSDARGAIFGLTRNTGRRNSPAPRSRRRYQTRDLLDAMHKDWKATRKELRVDGGATANDLLMEGRRCCASIDGGPPCVSGGR